MKFLNFEVIFIDDGSKDKSLNIIKELSTKDHNIKYISFSKNFGKEAAMYAGLEYSTGDYVTIMDVDLQDPPYLLEKMYESIKKEKYDCVIARRVSCKNEPMIRTFLTKVFYRIINKFLKINSKYGIRDYRLMTRQVVDSVLQFKEYNRYSKGIFSFVGFKTKYVEYENVKRTHGTTKWSLFKLFVYAIEGITSYTTLPLVVSTIIGMVFCLISFLLIIIIIIKTLVFTDPVSGWPSLACIIFFVSGIQLFCIGIVGQYLSKIYLEVKNRPVYIIKETDIKR